MPAAIDGAGDRVSDGDDEVAVELVLRGQREHAERLEHLTETFIVEEEEELVLDDRAAEVDAVLVAIEGRLLEGSGDAGAADGQRLEEAGGVEVGVADELVDRGVEVVGAAVRCDVDGGAGGAAILRALVVGYDLELRDGVGRNGDDLVVEALVALAIGVVVQAVEQEVVEHAALAVDVIRSGADQTVDGAGRGGGRRLARSGHQAQQVGVVAGDQRKRLALIIGDGLAAFAGLRLKLQGDIGDFDRGLVAPTLRRDRCADVRRRRW